MRAKYEIAAKVWMETRSWHAVAKACGVAESRVREWRNTPAFVRIQREVEDEAFGESRSRMRYYANEAVSTLATLMRSESEDVAFKAANAFLTHVHSFKLDENAMGNVTVWAAAMRAVLDRHPKWREDFIREFQLELARAEDGRREGNSGTWRSR